MAPGLTSGQPFVSNFQGLVRTERCDEQARTERPPTPTRRARHAVDYADLHRRDTLNTSPPALMSVALSLVTPFLTRLVSR